MKYIICTIQGSEENLYFDYEISDMVSHMDKNRNAGEETN